MEHWCRFKYTAYVDGGCPGNGWPEAVIMFGSYIIYDAEQNEIERNIEFDLNHPKKCTNNMAETLSLEALLMRVNNWNYQPISIYMDSQLVVNQFNGVYRVKDRYLKRVLDRMPKPSGVSLSWISGNEMKRILGH